MVSHEKIVFRQNAIRHRWMDSWNKWSYPKVEQDENPQQVFLLGIFKK